MPTVAYRKSLVSTRCAISVLLSRNKIRNCFAHLVKVQFLTLQSVAVLFQYRVCAFSLVIVSFWIQKILLVQFSYSFPVLRNFQLQFQLLKLKNPLLKGIQLQLPVKIGCFLFQYNYGFFLYALGYFSYSSQLSKTFLVSCSFG